MPISKRPNSRFFRLADYTPFPIQEEIHRSKADMRVVCVGRQVGKSEAAALEAVFELIAAPGSVGWVVAPTSDQSEIIFNRVVQKTEDIVEKLPHLKMRVQRRRNRLLVEHYAKPDPTGFFKDQRPVAVSEFRGKSADRPDNLRGATLDYAILDEAAMMDSTVWSEAIQPMLSTRKGWALFISTPKGHNWFYRFFRKGWRGKRVAGAEPPENYADRFGTLGVAYPDRTPESELDRQFESFHAASWEVREDVGLEWYQQAKVNTADQEFRQEFGAEFISHSGSVFTSMDLIQRFPYKEDREGRWVVEKAARGREYVIGADFGRSQDFSVFSVLDVTQGKIVCLWRTNEVSWAKQRRMLRTLAALYNDALIVADTWGIGDVLAEDLHLEGVRLTAAPFKTTAIKEDYINHFSLLMQNSHVAVPDNEIIFDELRDFQYHTTPSGNVTMRASGRGHDDIVVSLTLAYSQYDGGGTLAFDPESLRALEEDDEQELRALGELTEMWQLMSLEHEFDGANRMFQDEPAGRPLHPSDIELLR